MIHRPELVVAVCQERPVVKRADGGASIELRSPDATAVAGMKRVFWEFLQVPHGFHPSDVWGVLFTSRMQFCGDFVPRSKPITTQIRTASLLDGVRFWSRTARYEMVLGGFWPRLEVPEIEAMYFALDAHDHWVAEMLLPVLDGREGYGGPDRSAQVRDLWTWALRESGRAGRWTTTSVRYAARRALQSAGVETRDDEHAGQLCAELVAKSESPVVVPYAEAKRGDWRPSWRHLRDGLPYLRELRSRRRRARQPSARLEAADSERGAGRWRDSIPAPGLRSTLEALECRDAHEATEAARVVRAICEERAELPVRRRDDRIGPLVRRNFFSLMIGEVRQADLVRQHGLDKGNLSRAVRRERAEVLSEARIRLNS